MSRRDPLGTALTALWAAGHIAAATFLGIAIYEQTSGSPSTTEAGPDTPLTQPDPPAMPPGA